MDSHQAAAGAATAATATTRATGRPRSPAREAVLLALLVLATVVAYAPALDAGFIWDDDDYVTENPLLHAPDGLWRIWFTADSPSQYFPLTYTSFRAEYALWGLDPRGYHAVNILLHAANALLVVLVLRRARIPGALLAGAIFALHPVHVESVAWVTERKNVLSLFFMLVSSWCWLRFSEPAARRPGAFYAAALVGQALALLAKTTACTLPAAQVALLWVRDGRVSLRRLTQTLPFLALGVTMGFVSIWWEQNHQGTRDERFVLAPLEAVLVACRAVWFYLGKLTWPSPLIFSYPKFAIDPGDPWQYGWVLAGGLLLAALWRARHLTGPGPLAAALVFVGMLSPLLGFVPLFTFFYTYVADHYQYVASLGPISLFAAGAVVLRERWLPHHGLAAGAAVTLGLAVLGSLTLLQSQSYEDRETLWRDVVAKNPDSWMGHANLGREYLRLERFEEAELAYRDSALLEPGARSLLGLGVSLARQGRGGEALVAFQQAIDANTTLLLARFALARQYARMDQRAEAQRVYRDILALSPEDVEAHIGLSRLTDDRAEAAQHLRTVLGRRPGHPIAAGELALLLLDCDADPSTLLEARQLAELAVSGRPRNPRTLEALARARALEGDVAGAQEILDRALGSRQTGSRPRAVGRTSGDAGGPAAAASHLRLESLRTALAAGRNPCDLPTS